MKSSLIALSLGILASAAAAQTQTGIRVEVTTRADYTIGYWLVQNGATFPGTGRNLNWPDANPREYASTANTTTGIVPGALMVRWIPSRFNNMLEQQDILSFSTSVRPSAATATYPMTGYTYEMAIHQPLQLAAGADWAQGQQYTADFTKPAVVTAAKGSLSIPAWGSYATSVALATPVQLTQREIVMSLKYDANGQTTPINDRNPNHQATWNTWADNAVPATLKDTYFFYNTTTSTPFFPSSAPAGGTALGVFGQNFLSYGRTQPILSADADWTYKHNARGASPLWGTGISSAASDAATAAGTLRWIVDAGASQSGNFAFFLFNAGFGSVQSVPIVLGPLTLEINPADPNLIWLGLAPKLDINGRAQTAVMNIPALGPGAVGASFAIEDVFVKSDFSGFTGTTHAGNFRIQTGI